MEIFTFILRKSGDKWTAKQYSGDIEESAPSTFEIQRKLVKAADAADSSAAVRTSFSVVSPSSAIFQVVVGGAGIVVGGVAAAAAAPAASKEAAPAAEKKEEKVEEEEDDDDLGLSLFD
ncbi:60S acidic ribosomal protein P3-like [Cajanus cajan]|uniref:60S acidic ribosomal protein P3-like n=1 Tax=Cajanus cajan TaxID=3821 RepID=UPI00098D7864|nr:60S acidic ribosomal protein P3-like [Cajanus cajan]